MKKIIKIICLLIPILTLSILANAQCSAESFSLNTPSSSNIFSSSVNLTWSASSGAIGYEVFYRAGSSGSYSSGGTTSASVTSKTLTGLSNGTSYQIYIRASGIAPGPPPEFDPTSCGINSSSKTIITVPGTPTTQTASNIGTNSFTARWNSKTGATSYEIDVSTSSIFSSFVSGYNGLNVSSTSKSVTGLSPATRYYYRVRAVNGSGESSDSNRITVYTTPNSPTADQATNMTKTSFSANWEAQTGATSYQLDVSEVSDFSSFVTGYENLSSSGTERTVTGLTSGVDYYYRVRAVNSSGASGNSSTIETITIPGNPFSFPTDVTQSSFVAGWGAVNGATNYSIDVSTSNGFSSFVTGYEDLAVAGTSQTVIDLEPGTTYYYRVKAGNTSGYSGYSSTRQVITKPETPTAEISSNEQKEQFTANWSAIDIAPNFYLIDVSLEDDFSTFVSGYEGYNVDAVSLDITGLTAGTTYYYRLRSSADGGISGYSNAITTITSPDKPAALAPNSFAENSFVANWGSVTGAAVYRLDVSLVDDFSSFLIGYENREVFGTSQSVEGLTGGSRYFFRVRAENTSGISDYSNGIETITVATAPAVSDPTDHTETSFVAHWKSVEGVDNYLLDVSSSANFTNPVEGYFNLSINGMTLSKEVTGLTAGINYFYRVRAQNSSGISKNSSAGQAITIPAKTSITGFNNHTATKFSVSWESQIGVETYQIYVAKDANFSSPIEGNNPLVIQNILTETFIEGLTPNTIYFVKVISSNSSGNSKSSEIKTTSTTNSDGSVVEPVISSLSFDEGSNKISWLTSGGTGGITSIQLSHKKTTEHDFTIEDIELSENGSYEIAVPSEWMDMLGMQYQLSIEDLAGRTDISDLITFNKSLADVEVELATSFGVTASNYQIISVPYELSTTRIQDLFEGILGSYDKAKWRLLKYRNDNDGYVDYAEGLSVSNVQRGAGYWFISSEDVSLMFGSGLTPTNTIDEPFQLHLTKGWNQIGNPYLENISWQDILALNGSPETVGLLFTYSASSVSFVEDDILRVFGGGFVFADQDITLDIPVNINLSQSGGRKRNASDSNDENISSWSLDFSLQQGIKANHLAGIGMHPVSNLSKDQKDVLNPPYFSGHVAMESVHEEFFYSSFAKDIVSPSDQYHWEFRLKSNSTNPITLTWSKEQLPNGSLILYDLAENKLVDMHGTSSHTFSNSNQSFKIYYSKEMIADMGYLHLGQGYPNPMQHQIEIPYAFHIGSESTFATFTVYDMQGKVIANINELNNSQGIRSLVWNRTNNNRGSVDSGLYFYQIKSSTDGRSQLTSGKIIIK